MNAESDWGDEWHVHPPVHPGARSEVNQFAHVSGRAWIRRCNVFMGVGTDGAAASREMWMVVRMPSGHQIGELHTSPQDAARWYRLFGALYEEMGEIHDRLDAIESDRE